MDPNDKNPNRTQVPDLCLEYFDWNKWIEKGKNTALLNAAKHGSLDSVNEAVSAGADVNSKDDKTGRTALMEAVIEGHSECAERLLEMGAGVNAVDNLEKTVLTYAVESTTCELDVTSKLVQSGADVNRRDVSGKTALLYAVARRSNELIDTLLRAGASVNIQDKDGNSPLILEAEFGDVDNMKLLLKEADVNSLNNKGETALICAAKRGYNKCIDALIKAGADVNIRQHNNGNSSNRYNALEWACKGGYYKCVETFLDKDPTIVKRSTTHASIIDLTNTPPPQSTLIMSSSK